VALLARLAQTRYRIAVRWGLILVMLSSVAGAEDMIAYAPISRTLAAPETLDGIALPAGTKVIESGTPGAPILLGADAPVPVTIGGDVYPAHTTLQFQGIGKLHEARLSAPTKIAGIPVGTRATFHRNGRVWTLDLLQAHTVQDIPLPAGSWLFLDENGRLSGVNLPAPHKILSIPCGNTDRVEFHPNGKIRFAHVSEPYTAFGMVFPVNAVVTFFESGNYQGISFGNHQNGVSVQFNSDNTPKEARISTPFTVGNVQVPAESRVEFRAGKLREVYFDNPGVIQGIAFPRLTRAFFRDDGTVEMIEMSQATKPVIVQSLPCDGHQMVRLFANGKLEEASLAKPATVNGHAMPAGTKLQFTESGALSSADLNWSKSEPVLQGIPCARDARVQFHANGRLKQCLTRKAAVVDGKSIAARTFVDFDENGRVTQLR
jgi:hypothetical protein